jgi:hypothetical protein
MIYFGQQEGALVATRGRQNKHTQPPPPPSAKTHNTTTNYFKRRAPAPVADSIAPAIRPCV